MTKRYSIKEVFGTLQGEGVHAGRPAVFVRFTGCNMWSGLDKDRQRDAARRAAECPLWCDTDFRPDRGMPLLTREGIIDDIDAARRAAGMLSVPMVVFTGGEPLLQLTAELATAVRDHFGTLVAVETNGSVEHVPDGVGWVCMSPKQKPECVRLQRGDEIKVVYPAYNPVDYATIAQGFTHRWVSAEAATEAVGRSLIVKDNLRRAAEFCMHHTAWNLTLQSHKIIELP